MKKQIIDIINKIINQIKYNNSKKINIEISSNQNKNWRKNQCWYKNGKSNECELYQLDLIYKITELPILKKSLRFNLENLSFVEIKYPNKLNNGFEFTEDIDGYQYINNKNLYYNLKFVCDKGGAQTRSLREVYHLIKCQLNYLLYNNNDIFINILDGDESHRNMNKYNYLLSNIKYNSIQKNIFIGDMNTFQDWFISFNK